MKRLISVALLLAAVGLFLWGIVALLDELISVHWAQNHLGYADGTGNGPHYLFYSGFGSIVLPPVLTVLGVAAIWGWHNQCGIHGCYWPTRHTTAAGEKACWLHYPKITQRAHSTIDAMRERHHLYLGDKMGPG